MGARPDVRSRFHPSWHRHGEVSVEAAKAGVLGAVRLVYRRLAECDPVLAGDRYDICILLSACKASPLHTGSIAG